MAGPPPTARSQVAASRIFLLQKAVAKDTMSTCPLRWQFVWSDFLSSDNKVLLFWWLEPNHHVPCIHRQINDSSASNLDLSGIHHALKFLNESNIKSYTPTWHEPWKRTHSLADVGIPPTLKRTTIIETSYNTGQRVNVDRSATPPVQRIERTSVEIRQKRWVAWLIYVKVASSLKGQWMPQRSCDRFFGMIEVTSIEVHKIYIPTVLTIPPLNCTFLA